MLRDVPHSQARDVGGPGLSQTPTSKQSVLGALCNQADLEWDLTCPETLFELEQVILPL